MSVVEYLTAIAAVGAGVFAGGFIHEVAHYAVLKAFGRGPNFTPPKLSDGRLTAAVDFDIPEGNVPADIRFAAIAPVITGLLLSMPVLAVGVVFGRVGIAFAVGALIWITKPSPKDLAIFTGSIY